MARNDHDLELLSVMSELDREGLQHLEKPAGKSRLLNPVHELPVGTVTFLFTDIEGSTRLLKRWRERYAEALEDHQRILREAFAGHDGHEIDTQGDSFFVAFQRAKDAVAAAIETQQRLAQHDWPDGGELRVRMGIHTGEPAAAGARYVGLGVHRAARICAAGHGGQMLVSQTTRELLREDPLPDVSLRDLGEHQLKDLDEPERLYQLVAPGLDETFPPLNVAASTPFAGREGELAEAAAEQMSKRWHRPGRRTLVVATFLAAAVGVAVGVLATLGGGSGAAASVGANSVGVIDSSSGRIASTIPVGASPGGVAAGEGAIWVANTDDGTVSRIDPQTNGVRQTIQVGGGPVGVAAGGGAVWASNGLDGTVSRIDPTVNRQVGDPVRVGNGPVGIAYGAGKVWVVNSVDGTVSKIDPATDQVVFTRPAVVGATGVTVAFGRVWVVSPAAGVVVSLDPSSGDLVDRISVGVDPAAIASGAGAIWVANRADGTVSRIEPSSPAHVANVVSVGHNPDSITAGPTGIWVASAADGTLLRIAKNNRPGRAVRLENPPQGLALLSSDVYVTVRSNGLEHRGGTLRISEPALDSLDPALAYTSGSWGILTLTNDGLVGFRRVGGIEGVQLVPDLAASLPTPTDGGTTYRFRLRPGIRYSTGKLVQPADIRTELERVFELRPVSGGRQYYGDIVGAKRCRLGRPCDLSRGIATDSAARTITFHLTAPDADFLTKLAMPWADAVPAGSPPHDIGSRPLPATGPYVVASYRKNKSLLLTSNPAFHEWSLAAQPDGFPDNLSFSFDKGGHPGAELRTVEQGGADVAASLIFPSVSKQELASLATRYPSQLHLSPLAATAFFMLNTRVAPFDDVRVRRAINYAFDRQALVRSLGLGFLGTCQILPPNYPTFQRVCPYGSGGPAGLERGRRLVRSSGKAGTAVTVWGLGPRTPADRHMVAALRAIGFSARLKTIADEGRYFTRINDSRTRAQAAFNAWVADFPSVAGFLPPLFSCAAFLADNPLNSNVSEFCDRAVDRLVSRAESVQSTNPAAATALWRRAERAILAQAPAVPLYNQENVSFVAKRVRNFEYHPQWGVLLDQLWIK